MIERVGGCDLSFVDNSTAKKLMLFWCDQRKQWFARCLDENENMFINNKEISFADGEIALEKNEVIRVNKTTIVFAAAKCV